MQYNREHTHIPDSFFRCCCQCFQSQQVTSLHFISLPWLVMLAYPVYEAPVFVFYQILGSTTSTIHRATRTRTRYNSILYMTRKKTAAA